MSPYYAIISGMYPPIYIQALKDSEIIELPRTEFLKMWENSTEWKIILQKHTELDCHKLMKREFSFLLDDANDNLYLRG